MSLLFTPGAIGSLEIKNRIVRAPVYEARAGLDGTVGDEMIAYYKQLSRSGVGLICTGYMFVDPLGRAQKYQTGIHSDAMLPGLSRLADTVHEDGARIAFEISHAGRQTLKSLTGHPPVGPSRIRRDPSFLVKPVEMSDDLIRHTIDAFVSAAGRSVKAGSDIVYLHAGGGDLLNQFLSPFFNVRKDRWGGSPENRFRIMADIIGGIRQTVSSNVPILVKLNVRDFTPFTGVSPDLALIYAGWLADLGVDGLELTTGVKFYNHMNCWLGGVPVNDIVSALPGWKRPFGWLFMKSLEHRHPLVEGWNAQSLRDIRKASGDMALFLVGGLRKVPHMEALLENGTADFVALARPLIREPNFVKRVMEGKTGEATCISCNRCIAGVMHDLPTACYRNGLPKNH
jgi:2,4-dienoyl-CoA reductase-like NADH-dependent reductase (Old Yellow Enzyme family)